MNGNFLSQDASMSETTNEPIEIARDKDGYMWSLQYQSPYNSKSLYIKPPYQEWHKARLISRREARMLIPLLSTIEAIKYLIKTPNNEMMIPEKFWNLQGIHNEGAIKALTLYHAANVIKSTQ